MTVKFTLYLRNGCHLCDDVVAELDRLQPAYDFEWKNIDIDEHSELVGRYGETVPVLVLGEKIICTFFFDQQAFLGALQSAASGSD